MKKAIIKRLVPVPRDSGFRMEDYFIWCGSIIKAEGAYHMFAARWPRETGFPEGYRTHSEIVRAISDNPGGPYTFEEPVVCGRGGDFWDGQMCHNPKIIKAGDMFVLYYIGRSCSSKFRKVGYAWAPSVRGPWTRSDTQLPLGEDANNPAPYVHADGSILLAYRDEKLEMHVARANAYNGEYKTIATNIFPDGRLEDPDVFFLDGMYHMVMEDADGVLTGAVCHGGHLVSRDGIRWEKHDPVKAYTHTIQWTDGTSVTAIRRERPELFNDNAQVKGNGEPTHLLTGVLIDGNTWCVVQPIASG